MLFVRRESVSSVADAFATTRKQARGTLGTVTPRWTRIAPFVLRVAFVALGIWSLAVGDHAAGALQLAFSAFSLLMAFWDRRPAVLGGRWDGV
jgi:hypothetical protein